MDGEQNFTSLCDEDFEVIQAGVDTTYQSLEPSLCNSLMLHPMLVSTTTVVAESPRSEERGDNATVDKADNETIDKTDNETALLNSSVSLASSQSSDLMVSMLRTQLETTSLMEKQKEMMEEFSVVAGSIKETLSVQTRLEELQTKVMEAQKEIDDRDRTIASLKETNEKVEEELKGGMMCELRKKDSIIAQLSHQIIFLEQRLREDEQKNQLVLARSPSFDEMNKLRQDNDELRRSVEHLQKRNGNGFTMLNGETRDLSNEQAKNDILFKTLLDSGEECEKLKKELIMVKTNAAQFMEEMKRLKASNDALRSRCHQMPVDEIRRLKSENDQLRKSVEMLNSQLSEMYAKIFSEKKMSEIWEKSVDHIPPRTVSENQITTRSIEALMAKAEDWENLRQELEYARLKVGQLLAEVGDLKAIIEVQFEENAEGTRIIAENRRKISLMKNTLERFGHFSEF